MDISNMSKIELLDKCEELGILKYKSKSKSQLLELINAANIKSADEIPADLQSVKHPQNLIISNQKKHKSRRTSTSSIYVY
jgi:hypothetical protein